MRGTRAVLVLVADESAIDYANWLSDYAHVHVARTVAEARAKLNRAIDVVVAGDGLLGTDGIDREEIDRRASSCQVVQIGERPSEGGDCNCAVAQPVTRDRLVSTVTQQLVQTNFDRLLSSYYALVSMKTELEGELSEDQLATSDAYESLSRRVDRLREKLSETTVESDVDWNRMFEVCEPTSQGVDEGIVS